MPDTSTRRSERKRVEILISARNLFLKQGYGDTGMEVVARHAGVSTATLYAYFPSKAELFKVVILEAMHDIAAPVRASALVTGDARTRLLALANAYGVFVSTPLTRAIFRLVTAERRRFGDVADQLLSYAREETGGVVMALMHDLAKTGELRIDKPSWAAGQLLGMIDHVTLVFGLMAGDEARARRPLDLVCEDAVTTFLARYGVRVAA
jgi:AcrR family transcriptional regulator